MIKEVLDIKPKSYDELALIMGEFEEEKRLFTKSWTLLQINNLTLGQNRFNELSDFLKKNNIKHNRISVDMRFPTTNCEPM